ncbi:MAG: hypothetical protein M5U01_03225 [Ardenticatenaceae bacterium]|nr:hypothetical protein [Ardenticatenaceae bacterium]
MTRALQLGAVWRVLRQTNLDAIKREAEQAFRLLIVGTDVAEAERVARLLSAADGGEVHGWLSVRQPPLNAAQLRDLGQVDAAIILGLSANLPEPLHASRKVLTAASIPVLTIITDLPANQQTGTVGQRGGSARVTVVSLDADAVAKRVAPALLGIVPPGLRLALGRQLPPLRPALFEQLIEETARANASYSFSTGIAEIIPVLDIPLNVGDLIILTKNQLIMGYKIALAAGKEGEPRQLIGEIVGVLGGGFLFRQVARQLVGLIPVAGIVPKVAVAYAGTLAIGRAVVLWATEGQNVSPETLRQFYGEALERGRRVAEALVTSAKRVRRPRLPTSGGSREASEERPGLWQRVWRRLPF